MLSWKPLQTPSSEQEVKGATEWERSSILHNLTRKLSLVSAQGVSACLPGKVAKLGGGQLRGGPELDILQ